MLQPGQMLQVFLAAIVAVTTPWMLSQVAGFVLLHILMIGAGALALAAGGLWYPSYETLDPKT